MASDFSLGSPVSGPNFFGRSTQLEEIQLLLGGRSAINIYSLRRIGKTSLLRQIEYLCRTDLHWQQYQPIFIDLESSSDLSLGDLLLSRLNTGQAIEAVLAGKWHRIERCINKSKCQVLLLLDEVDHWLQSVTVRNDVGPLRALQQAGALNIVASTSYSPIFEHVNFREPGSPFYNIFGVLRLPTFLPVEASNLIVTLCQRGAVTIDLELAMQLARYVGYYPSLVQEIASVAFQDAKNDRMLSLRSITEKWRKTFGQKWIPFILRPFLETFEGSTASLAGVDRESHLKDALEDYGFLLRDSDGPATVRVAPYLQDLLNIGESPESMLSHLYSLAERHNRKIKDNAPEERAIQSIYIQRGEIKVGDTYKAGQVGAMGPQAHAHDMAFTQDHAAFFDRIDLGQLQNELSHLHSEMIKDAANLEHNQAADNIGKAEDAAKAGDRSQLVQYLKGAGKWALDTATKIGTNVAVDALKHALDLR
jgi:hypothetical protein